MTNGTETDFTVDEKFMPATEDASTELFEGIDEVYFLEIGFTAVTHELEKLSDTLFETNDLQKEMFKLKKQMQLVSKKITSFVVKNSLEFNKNVESLDVIKKEGESLLILIKQLRRLVDFCRKKSRASSIVLAIEFKRQLMIKIKQELVNIQKLYKTEFKLKELIEEGNIFSFIQLAVETITTINKYIKYSSIKQLSSNILIILKKEILKIDKLLEEQVCSFQLKHYFYIYSAYELLGNLEETSRKLQSYFKSAFQNLSWAALAKICTDSIANYQSTETDDQPNYLELCKFVNQKSFIRALIKVGNSLVNLLTNYHLFLQFHIEEDKKKASISIENETEFSECFDAPIIVDKGFLQKSLLDNLFQIFNYAATFYNDLLSSMDLEHLKIDQFLRIIEISERFRLFGQRHFGNPCLLIALTLENKSKSFFAHYHMERIDEIHMFLESETFTLCPVSIQFTLFDLPEFFFLKRSDIFGSDVPIMDNCLQANSNELDRQLDFVLIENSTLDVFPTLEQIDSSPSHSCDSKFSNSLSCDSPEDELDSVQLFQNKSMPNLCNTALNLLRIIGKYLRMAKILQSTAEQVFDAILQLFYYFIYSLYKYFCLDVHIQQQQQDIGTIFVSLRLRQLMDNLHKSYFCQTNGDSVTNEVIHHFPAFPNLSPDLNNKETLFSLAERLIGIESATFLSKQMELLRPALDTIVIDKKRKQDLENFYNTLPATSDLLEATLGCVAAKSLQSAQIIQQVPLIDWNITEIPSEHSTYVYSILKEFEFTKEILAKLSVYVHISEEVNFMIWSTMSMCTVRLLIRGYSESNKCSNEGRALQLMDVEHLFKKLEEFIGLRPFPHRLYVENYVKAFFLPSDDLNQWIVRHTEYTLSQTGALLNASISNAPTATKKAVTISRIMGNLLDASGISDGSNSLFH